MKKIDFEELIVFEDTDFLVIDKPTGVSSLAEHTAATLCIHDLAKAYDDNLRLCHRLDKITSGCLVLAKNDDAYRHMSIQFEERKVDKLYYAIAHGWIEVEDFLIDVPLIKKKNNTGFWGPGGKPSQTLVSTIEPFKHFSLMACKPITGRFHQIRLHLAFKGNPIAADTIYGGEPPHLSKFKRKYSPSKREENPMIGRPALHAKKIEFDNLKGERVIAETQLPKDIAVFLKLLRKHDSH